MRKITALFILVIVIAITPFYEAKSQRRGSLLEAQNMAEKAVQHIMIYGQEKAFNDFQDKGGDFLKADLYVFVIDMKCTFLAHGMNPKLVGRNIWDLRNPSGRYACRNIAQGLTHQNTMWSEYIFNDPFTKRLAWKKTFSIRHDDIIINVGAYNPEQKKIAK